MDCMFVHIAGMEKKKGAAIGFRFSGAGRKYR